MIGTNTFAIIRKIQLAPGIGTLLCSLALGFAAMPSLAAEGLSGKLIVGYQGWFGCPGDFKDNKAWQHWFVKGVRPDYMTVDMLPSVRDFKPEDLCDTGLPRSDGQGNIKLFSSQNPNVVNTHFRWMHDHGIEVAAAQRFVSQLSNPANKARSDNVLKNIKAAALANGRQFYVVYDISGGHPQTLMEDIQNDWRYLRDELKLFDDKAYLKDNGKWVVELWGFGLGDRPGQPDEVQKLINALKRGEHGLPAATVIGGVPSYWRSLTKDSKPDPAWADVYRSYDIISPWMVGRFTDDASAEGFIKTVVVPDIAETHKLGLRYMPVIFPGFSWYNLMNNRNGKPTSSLNAIPRRCGNFLWQQAYLHISAKADMLYGAMFDEADESTALFPTEPRMDKLPAGANMLFLNQDGCSLPDDWYLRVTGKIADYLRKRETPPKNIADAIRP